MLPVNLIAHLLDRIVLMCESYFQLIGAYIFINV